MYRFFAAGRDSKLSDMACSAPRFLLFCPVAVLVGVLGTAFAPDLAGPLVALRCFSLANWLVMELWVQV